MNNSYSSKSSNSNEKNILDPKQLSIDRNSSDSVISFSEKESYGIEENTYIEDNISNCN